MMIRGSEGWATARSLPERDRGSRAPAIVWAMGSPVLGIGELLWDVFPDGRRLGGAPFNVTANLRRLGNPGRFASMVGDDELGREALAAATDLGVETQLIGTSPDMPTGTVVVDPDGADGPAFEIVSPAAYESIALDDPALDAIRSSRPRGIVFGTLAQRFPAVFESTRRIVEAAPEAHRLYDVNLREGCWTPELVLTLLPLATIVKLNELEAMTVADILGCPSEPTALGERLAGEFRVHGVCVTSGASGAAFWMEGELHLAAGIPITVVDTVGAGDAFAAGLLHGVLEGRPAAAALALANQLGALVASRPGAIPAWRVEELGTPP